MKPEIEAKIEELEQTLKGMDVPTERKRSIPWLMRNLGVRNSGHKNYAKAMQIVTELNAKGVR